MINDIMGYGSIDIDTRGILLALLELGWTEMQWNDRWGSITATWTD